MSNRTYVVGYAQGPGGRQLPGQETVVARHAHAVLEGEHTSRCGRPVVEQDASKLFEQEKYGRCRICVGNLMNDRRS